MLKSILTAATCGVLLSVNFGASAIASPEYNFYEIKSSAPQQIAPPSVVLPESPLLISTRLQHAFAFIENTPLLWKVIFNGLTWIVFRHLF